MNFKTYDEFSHNERIHLSSKEEFFNGFFLESCFPGEWISSWEEYHYFISIDEIVNEKPIYGNVNGFGETTYLVRRYVDNETCIVDFYYAECDKEGPDGRLWQTYKENKRVIITYDPEIFEEIQIINGLKAIEDNVPTYEYIIDNLRLNGELPWPEEPQKIEKTLWGSNAPQRGRFEIVLKEDGLVLWLLEPLDDDEWAEIAKEEGWFGPIEEIVDEIPL